MCFCTSCTPPQEFWATSPCPRVRTVGGTAHLTVLASLSSFSLGLIEAQGGQGASPSTRRPLTILHGHPLLLLSTPVPFEVPFLLLTLPSWRLFCHLHLLSLSWQLTAWKRLFMEQAPLLIVFMGTLLYFPKEELALSPVCLKVHWS